MSKKLRAGDRVPQFELPDQNGEHFNSEVLRDVKHVIFFYPKDESLVCTKEACGFRDSLEEFEQLGARVIGVSGDSPESHGQFAQKHDLPFTLLSDQNGDMREKFGVSGLLFGLLPGRVTFVIDENGIVIRVISSMMRAGKHVREAIKALTAS